MLRSNRTYPVAVVLFALVWALFMGVDHRFISFSDGVHDVISATVADHGISSLYSDVTLAEPPGSTLLGALAWKVSPHVESIRVLLAFVLAIQSLLVYLLARAIRLGEWPSIGAAVLTAIGPVATQFSGLGGETFVGALAVATILLIEHERFWWAAVIIGLGLLFELTWGIFAIGALLAIAAKEDGPTAITSAFEAIGVAAVAWAVLILTFGWHLGDLVAQLVESQLHLGTQGEAAGILGTLIVLWWPLIVPAVIGVRQLPLPTRITATWSLPLLALVFKRGTAFDVLAPIEPFLVLAAVAGAVAVFGYRRSGSRIVVAVCAGFLVIHVATVAVPAIGAAVKFPIGAQVVDLRNESLVDRAASDIASHSKPGQLVFANPYLVLIAHRNLIDNEADWLALYALQQGCKLAPSTAHGCGEWRAIKDKVLARKAVVIGVDRNVRSFDPEVEDLPAKVGAVEFAHVSKSPIEGRLYAVPQGQLGRRPGRHRRGG